MAVVVVVEEEASRTMHLFVSTATWLGAEVEVTRVVLCVVSGDCGGVEASGRTHGLCSAAET